MLWWNGSIWKHNTDNAGTEPNSGFLYKHLHVQNPKECKHEKKKSALQFVKHSDLFQSWTVTRLGPDPDRLVFEMSSAFIGPEFPQVKLPKATDLTWEGKGDTWLPALYSASGCVSLPCSSLLTQLCFLLKWLDRLTSRKPAMVCWYSASVPCLWGKTKSQGTGRRRNTEE